MANFSQATKEHDMIGTTDLDSPTKSSFSDSPVAKTFHNEPHCYQPMMNIGRSDKRQGQRRPLCCEMLLIGDVADEAEEEPVMIPSQCLDIGDGGLYGVVPVGYGVAIGQRYTFRLKTGERGPEPGSLQVVSQRGRIIRTELLIEPDGSGDQIGVGVRLYGHRSGIVPMPVSGSSIVW